MLQTGQEHILPDQGPPEQVPRGVPHGPQAAGDETQRTSRQDRGGATQTAQGARPTRRQGRP